MKRALLAAAFSFAAFSASASDLPSRKAPPAPAPVIAPVFSWTGFYAGVNAGYAWSNVKVGVTPGGSWVGDPDWPGVSAAATHTLHPNGFTGGAQLGYNYQTGNLVLGIEGDLNFLNARASANNGPFPDFAVDGGTYSTATSVKANWLGTLRPRVGVAFDHLLVYATGGLAVSDMHFDQTISYINYRKPIGLPLTDSSGGANTGSSSKTHYGWTLGGGLEWALNNNWSVKGEYLYANLGKQSFTSSFTGPNPPPAWTISHSAKWDSLQIIRLGLNYRFGGPAESVVAKY